MTRIIIKRDNLKTISLAAIITQTLDILARFVKTSTLEARANLLRFLRIAIQLLY